MRIAVIGQKWFGAAVLDALLEYGEIKFIVAPYPDDRLAITAAKIEAPVHITTSNRMWNQIPNERIDLLVTAHAHVFVPEIVRRQASWAIGYHPSLLPLHRGKDAVAAAIAAGDNITGGTVYCLDNGYDTGPVVFRDWCFVRNGDNAATLWRRDLAPMGLALLCKAAGHLKTHGFLPTDEQETDVRGIEFKLPKTCVSCRDRHCNN